MALGTIAPTAKVKALRHYNPGVSPLAVYIRESMP